MSPNFASLTIFFPAFNEEDTIASAVDAACEVGDQLRTAGEIGTYEVLVIDDASTDATGAIVDELAAADPRVRAVQHPENRGLGGGIRTGLAESTGEIVLYTDADLPFDLSEVAKAIRLLRIYDADVVSAFRFDRTGEGARRFVYSYAYNHMIRWLFGLRIRDVNFACKLVRRDVLDHLKLESEGSFIDVELLVRAQRLGYKIVQFGVDYFPRTRGVSTLSSGSVILRLLRELWWLRHELRTIEPLDADERRASDHQPR